MTARVQLGRAGGPIAAILLLVWFDVPGAPVVAQGQRSAHQAGPPEVRVAARHDTSQRLDALPQLPPRAAGAVLRRKLLPRRIGSEGAAGDGALQDQSPAAAPPTPAQAFEGLSNENNVLPPDPTGDIGPNHYVQMVNLSFAVFDRAGHVLYGPVDNRTLWQGFGGACEMTNDGDPVVLYDQLADRWILSQLALPQFPQGPFYQCVAVSQTGNPTGAYHRYAFRISDDKLNDYPKLGVWSDAYYMAVNQFDCYPVFCVWAGQGAVAFERDRMLNGEPAQMVYFDLHSTDANLGGMLPADVDGPTPPPAGAPNLFCEIDDDAWGYSPDQLQCWAFRVNWSSPEDSSFRRDVVLTTAAFDSNLCGYTRNCLPQPGTSVAVDALPDRLMFRLQYRNFGSHETLVTNHTVDVGSDHAGIRWYELRSAGGGWSIFEQGTYAPDDTHRWMGSAAMNAAGDLAVGFSLAGVSVYPSIAAAGRLNGDSPGILTQGELVIRAGSGSQTHSSGRWGDYSQLSVDPVDDCTFWYTQEYYASTGPAPWRTWIGAFRLRDCSSDPPPEQPPAPATVHVGDLDGFATSQRNVWSAIIAIMVHGGGHEAVPGAAVTGTWSGAASGGSSCTTDGAGRCTVSRGGIRKSSRSATFTITGLTRASDAYVPAQNHDPDGDSVGTALTVFKP